MNLRLLPLRPDQVGPFKREMQEAFQLGATEGGSHEDVEILPEDHIDRSLSSPGAVAYEALVEGERVGGAVVVIDEATQHNHLDFLYVKPGTQGRGVGQALWNSIEERHAETRVWETHTPYFEKRNIHFYVNRCGFHIVEFFHRHHQDPHEKEAVEDGTDDSFAEMFRFEKVMKGTTGRPGTLDESEEEVGFYDLIADAYDEVFPLEAAKVAFVGSLTGRRVLDVGCGSGALGLGLAAEGVDYLGIDLNRRMIEVARGRVNRGGPTPEFRVMDMLAIDTLGEFDAVLCLGNTLPHLATPALVDDFFAKVHGRLAPGGAFVVQLLNYDRILADRAVAFDPLETPTVVFRRSYPRIGDDEVTFRVELEDRATGTVVADETRLQPLKQAPLVALAQGRGLVLEAEFRGFDRAPADQRDFSRVLVFRKSAR